ncbi:hypothetical protein CC86DRAFT_464752 [Ophiobolus disseminans]|uniref:Uncharacterized protein n=1 Tax=Ophiobolus disseminans TaxID=1469910 RepID=A0A6A7A6X2_9PLEO|nr:hypothetical protein CC86DRAFT_464752 [Ophiobolus disseminans]
MATPSPHDLASSVLVRLPRELRDSVYAYLWDQDILSTLDYPSLLISRAEPCRSTTDDEGNAICLCDTPASIPPFAQAVFVGYTFATEAVTWLYDNYEGFVLGDPREVMRFFTQDVFHIGVTPMGFPLRRLTLALHLGHPSANEYKDALAFRFAPLLRVETRVGARLHVRFESRAEDSRGHRHLFHAAMLMQALDSVVKEIKQRGIEVSMDFKHLLTGIMDVGHMLGPATYAHWVEFLRTEYAVALRRAAEDDVQLQFVDQRVRAMERVFAAGSAPDMPVAASRRAWVGGR